MHERVIDLFLFSFFFSEGEEFFSHLFSLRNKRFRRDETIRVGRIVIEYSFVNRYTGLIMYFDGESEEVEVVVEEQEGCGETEKSYVTKQTIRIYILSHNGLRSWSKKMLHETCSTPRRKRNASLVSPRSQRHRRCPFPFLRFFVSRLYDNRFVLSLLSIGPFEISYSNTEVCARAFVRMCVCECVFACVRE